MNEIIALPRLAEIVAGLASVDTTNAEIFIKAKANTAGKRQESHNTKNRQVFLFFRKNIFPGDGQV